MANKRKPSPVATIIDKLVEISRFYGIDPDFVLAGGGNTSAKTENKLYVKASGHALATIDADGFVEMDRSRLREILQSNLGDDSVERERKFKDSIYASRLEPEKNQRPSVEVLLHELIDETFVVHSHSTLVNMLACCDKGEAIAAEIFGDDVLWVGYVDPGYTLAKTVATALGEYSRKSSRKTPAAIIMQNHGLIVNGGDFEDIRAKTQTIIDKIRERFDVAEGGEAFGKVDRIESEKVASLINVIAPALRGLLADGENLKIVTFDDSDEAISLAGGGKGPEVTGQGPLTPDQIVYCGSFPLWFAPADGETESQIVERLRKAITVHETEYNCPPLVVIVKGLGIFAAGDDSAGAAGIRAVYLDAVKVMAGAAKLGQIRAMDPTNRKFIEEWEVEAYRKNIAKKSAAAAGRVAGKVAVVTGAAQGFGLEIAQDLAAQGACVVLADINEQGASEMAGQICKTHGEGRAIGLAMNVTDGKSIQNAIDRVVRAYGGLDLFISNAGVLKADSVKTQPEKDFDFVTAVNYKGYFLCVQKVAPVLAIQHLAKPDYMSDIIQINSKSGLVGSNRNGAYAGSKFGGIGLTQSFALELIADGVKVNSICPGNFFDGPLWSDPENGLFVQYLRTGKVSGAKTIEDVRRAYEAKVPIARGCETTDVMKAIYYLIEQKYETGQAVPVTGGQVMLS